LWHLVTSPRACPCPHTHSLTTRTDLQPPPQAPALRWLGSSPSPLVVVSSGHRRLKHPPLLRLLRLSPPQAAAASSACHCPGRAVIGTRLRLRSLLQVPPPPPNESKWASNLIIWMKLWYVWTWMTNLSYMVCLNDKFEQIWMKLWSIRIWMTNLSYMVCFKDKFEQIWMKLWSIWIWMTNLSYIVYLKLKAIWFVWTSMINLSKIEKLISVAIDRYIIKIDR
jgi:hypothetical protein